MSDSPFRRRFDRLTNLQQSGLMNQINENWFLACVEHANKSGHPSSSAEWVQEWHAAYESSALPADEQQGEAPNALFPRYVIDSYERPVCDGGGTAYGVIDQHTGTFAQVEPAEYCSGYRTPAHAAAKADEVNATVALAMRDWLADCVWADMKPEDFDALAPETLAAGVNGAYCGGLRQFYTDLTEVPVSKS